MLFSSDDLSRPCNFINIAHSIPLDAIIMKSLIFSPFPSFQTPKLPYSSSIRHLITLID